MRAMTVSENLKSRFGRNKFWEEMKSMVKMKDAKMYLSPRDTTGNFMHRTTGISHAATKSRGSQINKINEYTYFENCLFVIRRIGGGEQSQIYVCYHL